LVTRTSRGGSALVVALLALALILSAGLALLPADWQGAPPTDLPFLRLGAAPRPRATTPAAAPAPADDIIRVRGTPFGGQDALFAIRRSALGGFTTRLAGLLTTLLSGLLLLYLAPTRVARVARAVAGPWARRLVLGALGLAAALLVGALGVLAVFTIAGAPIWLAITTIGFAAFWLALAAVSLPLGRAITRRVGLAAQSPTVHLLAGLLALYILSLVPFVGGWLILAAALPGLGAVLQTRAGSNRPWIFTLPDLDY
jgi:hypothetical protein